MKNFSLLILLCISISCDKEKSTNKPQDDTDKLPNVEVVGHITTVQYPSGIPVRWYSTEQPTQTFIPNNHSKIAISGTHELLTVGGRNIVYFGTEIIDGVARIVLFSYVGKIIIADEVELPLMPDRHENLYAYHHDNDGNLYILAHCETTGYKKSTYVYKIDNLMGIEKISMPMDISFAVFKTEQSGIVALKALHLSNRIELTVGYSSLVRWQPELDMTGDRDYEVRGAYRNQEDNIILVIKCVDKATSHYKYYLFTLDVYNNKVIKHKIRLDSKNYTLGRGYMEGNILHIPGAESNSNKAFTLQINTQTDLNEILVTKTDLEVEDTVNFVQALFIKKMDGGYYVGGTHQEKACYWINNKQVKLSTTTEIKRSYPVDILTYRIPR